MQSCYSTLYQRPIDACSLSGACLSHGVLLRTVPTGSGGTRTAVGCNMRKVLEKTMKDQRLLVSIVDDDQSVRESLPDLTRSVRLCSLCVLFRGRVSRIWLR